MSKRVNNIFFDKLKFKNMIAAYEKTSKGKKSIKKLLIMKWI